MATSDNVVRAGLTPKLRDVDTLVSMLTYEAAPGDKQLLRPTQFQKGDDTTKLYDPPIAEFSVLRTELSEGTKTSHRPVEGPSVCVITEGAGVVRDANDQTEFVRGDVIFVGAGKGVEWEAKKELEMFRAYVEA